LSILKFAARHDHPVAGEVDRPSNGFRPDLPIKEIAANLSMIAPLIMVNLPRRTGTTAKKLQVICTALQHALN
jgi:hypothetical protein